MAIVSEAMCVLTLQRKQNLEGHFLIKNIIQKIE